MLLRLAVLMFCVFSITTGEFVVAGILPEVAGDLAISVGTAGLLVTAYASGMIIGGPILTALTAGSDRKRLMLILLGVAVAGNVLSALAPNFTWLLVSRLVTALVTSTFFAQAIVVAVRSAPREKAASTVARLAFGMNLAMILGAPIGTAIGGVWGWRATFWAIGLACLAGFGLVSQLITPPNEESRGSAVAELRVLRRRPVLLALAITAVGNVGILMVFIYLAPLLTGLAGHPDGRLPLLLLGYGVGATVGNLVGGTLYDRNPRTFQPMLLGLLAAVLTGTWVIALTPAPTAVAVVLLGGLGFAIIPGMQTRVMHAASEAPTLAMAVNASGYQVAAACAGLLGGFIADSGAGPRPIYLVAAVFTICGMLLTLVGVSATNPGGRARRLADRRR
ncbi:MFS transporter [Phytoactinopolyspora mesophila]|uniref:MFS transporter n=1 Tax=Phytoactinopolyspora mesophila TaxID=2650750 RepID=A0A7K3MAQ7_9ACTN|nr:MFS transporter [Phytoactinopolyspora mesophila]NDL59478.1 MFS transporter [Phytoactinopolyspora mesophila]